MVEPTFRIVEAIYPGMTQLDFTGPHTVFSRLPNTEIIVASEPGGTIESDGGLAFAGTRRMAEIDRCDLLFFPGGLATTEVINDAAFMREARRLAAGARYLTSVCTGSLILGAAGLLKGRRAACHWAWRSLLPLFGAIPDEGRVVRDGDIFTGGGVTAGIDFALTLAAELADETVAHSIQLSLEYAPAPPFNAGRPETAPPEVLASVNGVMAQLMPSRTAGAREAAARLARAGLGAARARYAGGLPHIVPIDDPDDPRIAVYRQVRERDLVGRGGGFIAEGEVVLRVLLGPASRFAAASLLVAEKRLERLAPLLARVDPEVPVYAAGQAVMDAIVGFHIHRGILAHGLRGPEPDAETLMRGLPPRAVVLMMFAIANHDNLGGLFRNAAAFGADAVLLDAASCDPLYRKAIRVSVGAALSAPFARLAADQDPLGSAGPHRFRGYRAQPGRGRAAGGPVSARPGGPAVGRGRSGTASGVACQSADGIDPDGARMGLAQRRRGQRRGPARADAGRASSPAVLTCMDESAGSSRRGHRLAGRGQEHGCAPPGRRRRRRARFTCMPTTSPPGRGRGRSRGGGPKPKCRTRR